MKHYLIDSENVGDFWIPLLELPADSAELIVFYTKNSPHMSYDSLIKLKESDRKVTFIKCYEGTNALDFQLCSELGFLIAQNPGDEFIIVTNDTGYDAAVKYWRRTGYDAAVKYWRRKEYSVKRIAGKDSRTGSRRRGTTAKSDVAAEVSAILHKLVRTPDHEESGEREEQAGEETMDTASEASVTSETDPEEDLEEHLTADEYPEEEFSDEDYEEDSEEYSEEAPEEEPAEIFEETAAEDGEAGSDEAFISSEIREPESSDLVDEGTDNDGSAGISSGDEPEGDSTEISSGNGEDDTDESSENEETQTFVPDPDEITAIGMENLAELHNQLIQFYGDDGKDVYQSLKSGTLTIEKKDWDKAEKFLYYCVLIFRHSDVPQEELSEENISEFAQFLLGAENKRKNLNSLRYALLKHYGKEKGRRYYFMLKPYVKALNQM